MGRITFDPVAPAAKREKEERKYPPQAILGFRLLGYRVRRRLFKPLTLYMTGVTYDRWGNEFGRGMRRSFRNSCARFPSRFESDPNHRSLAHGNSRVGVR